MSQSNRRTFMLQVAAAGSVLVATQAQAQVVKVDEKDPQAAGLGYVADTNKADGKKFTKHSKDQKCGGCTLFQGKAGDAWGVCPLFGTKQVSANGWCSAYAKKA